MFKLGVFSLILLSFSIPCYSQTPAFISTTPITGNSGSNFFVFLPMQNVGSGDATNIQLKSVALTHLGQPATTLTQPSSLPSTVGFAAPTGTHVLDLEFDNSSLQPGNRYMLTLNGSYEANGVVSGFQLNRPVLYAAGFAGTKNQVLSIIYAKFDALPNVDPVADDQVLVAFLQGLPQVLDVGSRVDPALVWVDFRDGSQRLNILNDIKPPRHPIQQPTAARTLAGTRAPAAEQKAVARTLAPATKSLVTGSATELPGTTQVRVLNELDFAFEEAATNVRAWLTANGYKQASGADGSIAGLRTVGNDGVLYITSHGGISKDNGFFIVSSDAELTNCDPGDTANFGKPACPDTQLPDDIKNDLVIATAARDHLDPETGRIVTHGNFAITSKFVHKYWGDFAENAFVYIDACHSNQDDPGVQAFKDVILQEKNASVYAGWSTTVGDGPSADSARLVFDRLLGANRFCPEDGAAECSTGPAIPPVFAQRPFDFGQVLIDLPKHGLGMDTDPDVTLGFVQNPNGGNFGLLAPSIFYLIPEEGSRQLFIQGTFGSDPGDSDGIVTINGIQVNREWTNDLITADLTSSDGGDVVVSVRGHKSNPARLTKWQGTFHAELTGPDSAKQVVDFKASFRADLRKSRIQIHAPPLEPVSSGIELIDSESSAPASCSGIYTETLESGTDTFTWKGGANLAPFDLTSLLRPPAVPYFFIVGALQGSHTEMLMQLNVATNLSTTPCQEDEHIVFIPPPGGLDIRNEPLDIQFSSITSNLSLGDTDGVIVGDTQNFVGDCGDVPVASACKVVLTWESITPVDKTAPDPKSPR